ncbi:MAG: hypothetical protein P1U56_09230 [Saprospiraceae bacterium]|nr:hypothetical protein [Saprospiraceae bacterium]
MSALTIIKAIYSGASNGADVTAKCQSIVDTGNDDIAVNNNTFGDSDPNYHKVFWGNSIQRMQRR